MSKIAITAMITGLISITLLMASIITSSKILAGITVGVLLIGYWTVFMMEMTDAR